MTSTATTIQAILWVALSTAIFTVIFAAAKFTGGQVSVFQIMLLRYIGAFVTVLAVALRYGPLTHLRSRDPARHALRSLCGSLAAAAITWASAHMAVADASAIGSLYGVITVLLGGVVLHERISPAHCVAVLVSVLGAGLIMLSQGAFQSPLSALPALAALASAALMAAEGVLIRVLSQRESALSMMAHVTGFGIVLMTVPAALSWGAVSLPVLLGCLLLGPVSVIAQYCTIRGYRIAPLSVVGPVDYSWLIFAGILGAVAFGELPGPMVIAGGALIILGGGMLTLR